MKIYIHEAIRTQRALLVVISDMAHPNNATTITLECNVDEETTVARVRAAFKALERAVDATD